MTDFPNGIIDFGSLCLGLVSGLGSQTEFSASSFPLLIPTVRGPVVFFAGTSCPDEHSFICTHLKRRKVQALVPSKF